eukprot:GILI01002975.1.p1 GENE.GILI01002975.1~~GILI01002975.1.p1  ORF type:complete len:105 (+),score=22.97 GILI01002975.1:275-589(+)
MSITHTFRDVHRAAAAPTAGGAATRYEAVKVTKYAPHIRTGQRLVPFTIDTFGAMGSTALALTRKLVPLFARCQGLSAAVASRVVFSRLTTAVIGDMARIATLA